MDKATQMQKANGLFLAARLIRLGARQQLLEHEFPYFSRKTLLELYREIIGESPPKGMLPFSEAWFLTWQPNMHASLFFAYYEFFKRRPELSSTEVLMRAYDSYIQEASCYRDHNPKKPVFSLTRAWMLIRLMRGANPILTTMQCSRCGGRFVVENYRPQGLVCGLCKPPARAGHKKGRARERYRPLAMA